MIYRKKIEARGERQQRPKQYEQLLITPIADDPLDAKQSYEGWEFDHGDLTHFYVGGLRTFMKESKVSEVQTLAKFGEPALELIKSQTDWAEMPGGQDKWDAISLNQFRFAKLARPMQFAKAAAVIVACELALEKAKTEGRVPEKSSVYNYMTIVPACWSIDGFNEALLEKVERRGDAEIVKRLTTAGHRARELLGDLARGQTAQFETVKLVRDSVEELFPDLHIGNVRAHPGRRGGKKSASEAEERSDL